MNLKITRQDQPGDYAAALRASLPPGPAFSCEPDSVLDRLLLAIGARLAQVETRAWDLLDELDPRTTRQLVAAWERYVGLPDECFTGIADTLQERRDAIVQKLTLLGGQSRAFFEGVAAILGYQIVIQEFGPFIAGIDRCGDRLGGIRENRFHWLVTVSEPRATRFRTGESAAGERLLSFDRADDLECVLDLLRPAHTNLIFAYEGV